MKQSLLAGALISTLGTATLVQATPAQAFVLDINPTTAFSSNESDIYGTGTGASALLDFKFVQVGSQVRLDLGITNTTNQNTSPEPTLASLRRVFFDLPSIVTLASYTNSLDFPNIAFDQPFRPFTNNAPTGYPGANPGPNVRFDVEISFQQGRRGNPTNTLLAGESTLVSFLFNTAQSANNVEGAFYWGFLNVDGTGPVPAEPLRAALRFQEVGGPGYTGSTSDKLLAKPEAVPTPALLPALVGLGLGMMRKKQQVEQDA
ncbi:MAG: PTPA-CTERM sorting domain-containing protein [Leptolyngbyaceae cyanobacterium bins.302]|nr:PTPA-CTERM sorting domain-containing protein [Leptolyngbyaceae cyanobacterium bins.302]